MPRNGLKSLIERLFWGENLLRQKRDETLIIRERAANADELMLGSAEGEDEETGQPVVQLKGISQEHRNKHFYIAGGTGVGKSKFIESLILQDIRWGNGFGVIDPHGDQYNAIKAHLIARRDPEGLAQEVVLIDPTDPLRTATFNPLELIEGVSADELANTLIFVFKKIWADSWGNRMEDIMRWSMVALAEQNLTLYELPRLLTDVKFRARVLAGTQDEQCRYFFEQRLGAQTRKTQNEWAESTLNKISALLSNRNVRHIFLSAKSSFNLRDVIDSGKILLIKLDRGRLMGSADLLGALLIAKIQLDAFSRGDMDPEKRAMWYLYIDEFQNFATDSFAQILSEARKYNLALILAHQHLSQLPRFLRDSILSNCAIQTCFRLNRDDASTLAHETMTSIFTSPPGWEHYVQELQMLRPRECYVKNTNEGGVVKIYTLDVPAPHEYGEKEEWMGKEELAERIATSPIGSRYLRLRSDIDEEYRQRKESFDKPDTPEDEEIYNEPMKDRELYNA